MIRQCIQDTPQISPQLVETYKPIVWFMEDHHHMYIQAKKYLREEWVKKKYRITEEDIELIMQDWDTDWKVPSNEQEMETPDPEIEEVQGQGNDTRKKRKDVETEKGKSVSTSEEVEREQRNKSTGTDGR
jgi:hypothetical protein